MFSKVSVYVNGTVSIELNASQDKIVSGKKKLTKQLSQLGKIQVIAMTFELDTHD